MVENRLFLRPLPTGRQDYGSFAMTTDVYAQFFSAEGTFNGRERHAALVTLTVDSEQGQVKYTAAASFFPHDAEDDFAVSYDASVSEVLFEGKGRRSKKRETELLEGLQDRVSALARNAGAKVFWDAPLREARRG